MSNSCICTIIRTFMSNNANGQLINNYFSLKTNVPNEGNKLLLVVWDSKQKLNSRITGTIKFKVVRICVGVETKPIS